MLDVMNRSPYLVSIVVNRNCGLRLRELGKAGPVWIVDSPANRGYAEQLWSEFPNRNHLDGITLFDSPGNRTPEQMLIDQMETIDLHHGPHSADPPYTVICVFGSTLTQEVRQVLASFGFNSFTANDEGFEAVRPLPPPLGSLQARVPRQLKHPAMPGRVVVDPYRPMPIN